MMQKQQPDDVRREALALRKKHPLWSAQSIGKELLRRYGQRPVMPLLRLWLNENTEAER